MRTTASEVLMEVKAKVRAEKRQPRLHPPLKKDTIMRSTRAAWASYGCLNISCLLLVMNLDKERQIKI